MALARVSDPFQGLATVHRNLDDVLNGFLNDTVSLGTDNVPAMDLYIEDDKRLVAEVHLPGFSPENVEIRVQDNILEIRGERQESVEDEDKHRRGYLVRQSVERFFRRIALPKNADQSNVQADFEDGVLQIVVPFVEEQEGQKVEIGTGSSGRTKGKEAKEGTAKEDTAAGQRSGKK